MIVSQWLEKWAGIFEFELINMDPPQLGIDRCTGSSLWLSVKITFVEFVCYIDCCQVRDRCSFLCLGTLTLTLILP